MVARSQNGWTANDRSVITTYELPGGKVALRKGDVATILLWVANQFHERVEPLVWPGVWGYAERPIRGGTQLSNHASGTAIDLNAPYHPMGKRGTFTGVQVAAIREILTVTEGVVRWGGDYTGRPDEMHFEINAGPEHVARIAQKIRERLSPGPQIVKWKDDMLAISVPIRVLPDKTFREAVGAEAGAGSMVANKAVITFGSTWGDTVWTVAALSHDAKVLSYWPDIATRNNTNLAKELPTGTRCVTVEGRTEHEGTRPWASIWMIR